MTFCTHASGYYKKRNTCMKKTKKFLPTFVEYLEN